MRVMKSRNLVYLILLVFAQYGCFTVKSNSKFIYQKVKPDLYKAMLNDSSNYYLIDVRTKNEYKKSHINDAVNYSFLSFKYRKYVKNLDRTKTVFLYCQTCHRSPLAARKMKKMGFVDVVDLKGGYAKWKH